MREALDAILAQSYRPLEVIVIDDASTDDSYQILQRYSLEWPGVFTVIANDRNLGVLENAKRLLALASGDCVFFTAMDDRILPEFLERSMALFSEHPQAGLCSTLSGIIDASGRPQGLVRLPIPLRSAGFIGPADVAKFIQSEAAWFSGNSTVYRREALIQSGGFRPDLRSYADGFVSLVVALRHGACFIPEPLALWRRMAGTYSQRTSRDADTLFGVLDRAVHLMQTEFSSVFTPKLIATWKSELYYGVASSLAKGNGTRLEQLKRIVPATGLIARAFYLLADVRPELARWISKPTFFVILRWRYAARTLRRQIMYLCVPRLRRWAE